SLLITFFSTYFVAAKTWWLPHGVSTSAPWIDHQFALTFVVMGVVFVAAQVSLGYLVWKYRARPSSGPVRYSHGNTTLEILWTALTAILFIGLNLMGSSVWATERFEPRSEEHTSELQSPDQLVCRLLLEKKNRSR